MEGENKDKNVQEDELDQIISKGQLEKSKDEDEKLKQQVTTYTQYEDLADFGEDHLFKTDLEQYLKVDITARFEDPENWTGQFDAINEMRIMNKYHVATLMKYLNKLTDFIKNSVDNLRSGISKNALMLTTEISLNEDAVGIKSPNAEQNNEMILAYVNTVLPSVLFKTVYDKVFISREAKNTINNSLKEGKCLYKEMIIVLIDDGCNNKYNNKKLQEESYSYISLFIKNVDNQFFQAITDQSDEVNTAVLGKLMNQLYIGIDSMPRIKKASNEVLKTMATKLKDNNPIGMEDLLKVAFKAEKKDGQEENKEDGNDLPYDQAKVDKVMKIVAVKETKKAAGPPRGKDFRSFLKQQKIQQPPKKDGEIIAVDNSVLPLEEKE